MRNISFKHALKSSRFLDQILENCMQLNSMELVNRLAQLINLPNSFLHSYISHCIRICEETHDKYLQMRHVRLLSVFLQSFLRNKIPIQEFCIEIESFCISFSKIKEAAGLFKLLKEIDINEGQLT